MNFDAICEVLQEVEYRPEWTITAHRHPFGTYILIDAEVIDSEKYQPEYTVAGNYEVGNTTRVGVRACVPPFPYARAYPDQERKFFLNWLLERLIKVERHECREFFKWRGRPWNSPHQRPQPKHDYHVRRITDDHQQRCFGHWKAVGLSGFPRFGWKAAWGVFVDDPDAPDRLGMCRVAHPNMRAAYLDALKMVVNDDLGKGMEIRNG